MEAVEWRCKHQKPYSETLDTLKAGVNHLAGHGGVVGADDDESGRNVGSLRLDVDTCRHML